MGIWAYQHPAISNSLIKSIEASENPIIIRVLMALEQAKRTLDNQGTHNGRYT